MRAIRLAVLPLLVATSLAAQAPAPSNTAAPPIAVLAPKRTAFFDVVALIDGRQRFGLEPLVFGRWTVGLTATHSRTAAAQTAIYAQPLTGGPAVPTTLCPVQGCPGPYPGSASGYNAWSLDFGLRYYPAALSFNDPRRRFLVYIGEFIGYQYRTMNRTAYPMSYVLMPDTIVPTPIPPCMPPGCMPMPTTETQVLSGWEPGAEVGMRLVPLDPVFIDVGGWFKLVTVDDPMQRIRPGQVDSRLVVAVGIGW